VKKNTESCHHEDDNGNDPPIYAVADSAKSDAPNSTTSPRIISDYDDIVPL